MKITITRQKDSEVWGPYTEIDTEDRADWPPDLPDDVAALIEDGLIPNEKHSPDGYRYRILPK